jgi:glycosyltransferase involved in cell wall biosynthesis
VLMPCFNAAAFITRAVRSVLDQAQVREAVKPRKIERRARR